jgi:hypothetical protein
MARTSLVAPDLTVGAEMVSALEKSRIQVAVALWMLTDEYSDWKFVISSPDFQDLHQSYSRIRTAAEQAGISYEQIPPVLVLMTTDSFIQSLRSIFAKTKNVLGMRLGGQTIGDRYVEDAYVYKIA